jgi:hypothetical protein
MKMVPCTSNGCKNKNTKSCPKVLPNEYGMPQCWTPIPEKDKPRVTKA